MPTMKQGSWWLTALMVIALVSIPVWTPVAFAYSGGFFDDGFYDDDWYFDFYDSSAAGDDTLAGGYSDHDDEYDAKQFYDDAGESGLFDV